MKGIPISSEFRRNKRGACTVGMLTCPETMSGSEWDEIQRLFKSETSDREDTLVLVVRIRVENTGKVADCNDCFHFK